MSCPRYCRSNVLSLRIRSLHSLPDCWLPGTFPFTFTASLSLPSSSTRLTFPQGKLQLPPSEDHASLPTHWQWPGTVVVPEAAKAAKMEPCPLEEEVGVYHSSGEVRWREKVEGEKPRVSWNSMQQTWLTANMTASLMSRVIQHMHVHMHT